MIYLDTSAFVKLVWREPESDALWSYISARPETGHISSRLLTLEARRAALRSQAGLLPRIDLALERVGLVDVSAAVMESASRIPTPELRSLDAIHLATALMLQQDVDVMITYDQRLAAATSASGVAVVAPR